MPLCLAQHAQHVTSSVFSELRHFPPRHLPSFRLVRWESNMEGFFLAFITPCRYNEGMDTRPPRRPGRPRKFTRIDTAVTFNINHLVPVAYAELAVKRGVPRSDLYREALRCFLAQSRSEDASSLSLVRECERVISAH